LAPVAKQAAGHMYCDDLVRAQDHFRMLAAFAVPRAIFSTSYLIGTEISEMVIHSNID